MGKLEEAIYQKYIIPTERTPHKHVGVEFEFPVLNLAKKGRQHPRIAGNRQGFCR